MNKTLNIVGWIMIAIYAIGTVFYWDGVYPGGIGLFGSLVTLPMAIVLAFFISTFSSLFGAITNIVWALIVYWLITRGVE